MAIDNTYQKRADESIEQYTSRIAAYNASKAGGSTNTFNSSTGKTNQQVLDTSTQVAQNAAKIAGLTFTPGYNYTPPTPTQNQVNTLNNQNLQSSTPIEPKTIVRLPPPSISGIDFSVPKVEASKPEQEAIDLNAQVRQITEGLIGESAFRTQQEETAGIPELEKAQNDLSARLKQLVNQEQAIRLQYDEYAAKSGLPQFAVDQRKTEDLRKNAIEALTVSSLFESSKGNLSTARAQVERAVAAKYDPIREEIAVKTSNLDLLLKSPEISIAEQNRANELKSKLKKQEVQVEQQARDQQYAYDLAIEAQNAGVTDINTLQAIQGAATPQEAYQIAQNAINQVPAQVQQQVATDPITDSYADLVRSGQLNISSVPASRRDDVVLALSGKGSGGTSPTVSGGGTGSGYSGGSIVDYLNSIGQDSSFSNRAKLAAQAGIANYSGTAAQNTQLLNVLRGNKGQSSNTTMQQFSGITQQVAEDPGVFNNLTPTNKTKVITELSLGSKTSPAWFRQRLEQESQQSLTDVIVQRAWDAYKAVMGLAGSSGGSKSDEEIKNPFG